MTHWSLHKNLALGDRGLDLKSQIESVVCVSLLSGVCIRICLARQASVPLGK